MSALVIVGLALDVFIVLTVADWRRHHPTPPPPAPRPVGWAIDGCGRPRRLIPLGRYEPVALIPDAWERWQAALDRHAHHQIGATP